MKFKKMINLIIFKKNHRNKKKLEKSGVFDIFRVNIPEKAEAKKLFPFFSPDGAKSEWCICVSLIHTKKQKKQRRKRR